MHGQKFCVAHLPMPADVVQAMLHPMAFASCFKNLDTFKNWQRTLRIIFGLPFESETDLEFFQAHTGRTEPRLEGYDSATLLFSRQSGKSLMAGYVCAWAAIFHPAVRDPERDEPLYIFISSDTVEQSKIVFGYIKKFLRPFKKMVVRESNDTIELSNGVTIAVRASRSAAVLRGWRILILVVDEISFLQADLPNLIEAALPAIVEGGKMLLISSIKGRRSGPVWDIWKKNWGKPTPTLVMAAGTSEMNPAFSSRKILRDIEENPRLRHEYYTEWEAEGEAPFNEEFVRVAAVGGTNPFNPKNRYYAFWDTAGNHDANVLAICHADEESGIIVDYVQERKSPGDFAKITEEFCGTVKEYKAQFFTDKWGFAAVESLCQVHGVNIEKMKSDKQDAYYKLRTLLETKSVVMPNNDTLIDQLLSLDFKDKRRQGGTKIDHRDKGFDDVSCAVAMACLACCQNQSTRVRTGMPVTMRHEHYIPEQQREREVQFEMEGMEDEWKRWAEESLGLLSPILNGRTVVKK